FDCGSSTDGYNITGMLKKNLKILIADYGDNARLLLKRADEAFYASKNKERDCYQFFSQNIEKLPA
ncbi:MAG TPA: hypothetical protein QGI40_05195, partial [Nitrospinaceae bacterium]|nr:hypothetical protein [Nitrospinaceae bacterium]